MNVGPRISRHAASATPDVLAHSTECKGTTAIIRASPSSGGVPQGCLCTVLTTGACCLNVTHPLTQTSASDDPNLFPIQTNWRKGTSFAQTPFPCIFLRRPLRAPAKRHLLSNGFAIVAGNSENPGRYGGRTVHRARAVRKVGYFGPIFPDGQGDTVKIVLPGTGLLRFLLSPKPQIMT